MTSKLGFRGLSASDLHAILEAIRSTHSDVEAWTLAGQLYIPQADAWLITLCDSVLLTLLDTGRIFRSVN